MHTHSLSLSYTLLFLKQSHTHNCRSGKYQKNREPSPLSTRCRTKAKTSPHQRPKWKGICASALPFFLTIDRLRRFVHCPRIRAQLSLTHWLIDKQHLLIKLAASEFTPFVLCSKFFIQNKVTIVSMCTPRTNLNLSRTLYPRQGLNLWSAR